MKCTLKSFSRGVVGTVGREVDVIMLGMVMVL